MRSNSFKIFLSIFYFFCISVGASAQEESPPTTEKVNEATEDSAAEENSEKEDLITLENYFQRLTSIPNIMNRRDPFETQAHPYAKKFSAIDRKEVDIESVPPLQRFPIKSYNVNAVLIGRGTPRALVSIPQVNNKTWIVKAGSLFGNRGGKIDRITKKGLHVIEEVINSEGDKSKVELEIPVNASLAKNEGSKK